MHRASNGYSNLRRLGGNSPKPGSVTSARSRAGYSATKDNAVEKLPARITHGVEGTATPMGPLVLGQAESNSARAADGSAEKSTVSPCAGINHLGGALRNSSASQRRSAFLSAIMNSGAMLLNLRPGPLPLRANMSLMTELPGSTARFMMTSVTYHTRPASA